MYCYKIRGIYDEMEKYIDTITRDTDPKTVQSNIEVYDKQIQQYNIGATGNLIRTLMMELYNKYAQKVSSFDSNNPIFNYEPEDNTINIEDLDVEEVLDTVSDLSSVTSGVGPNTLKSNVTSSTVLTGLSRFTNIGPTSIPLNDVYFNPVVSLKGKSLSVNMQVPVCARMTDWEQDNNQVDEGKFRLSHVCASIETYIEHILSTSGNLTQKDIDYLELKYQQLIKIEIFMRIPQLFPSPLIPIKINRLQPSNQSC